MSGEPLNEAAVPSPAAADVTSIDSDGEKVDNGEIAKKGARKCRLRTPGSDGDEVAVIDRRVAEPPMQFGIAASMTPGNARRNSVSRLTGPAAQRPSQPVAQQQSMPQSPAAEKQPSDGLRSTATCSDQCGGGGRMATRMLARSSMKNLLGGGKTTSLANLDLSSMRRAVQTMNMYEKDQKVQKDVPESYEETAAVDMRRKRLLYDARLYSPIDMVLRVDKLTQTVLLPLLRHPVTWIVSLVYSASAIGARYGGLQYGDLERDTFDGTNSMVTFMVVFYVGYCYSRFGSMFQDLEQVMRGVINCSAVARGSFRSKRALYDLWRYLNLLHVTAYCGVTTTYSKQNLLDHFAHHYALLIYPEVEKKLFSIDIDNHGALAANTCMVWALEVVQERFDRGDFSAPMHKEMTETITAIGTGLARLYAQEYQVRLQICARCTACALHSLSPHVTLRRHLCLIEVLDCTGAARRVNNTSNCAPRNKSARCHATPSRASGAAVHLHSPRLNLVHNFPRWQRLS